MSMIVVIVINLVIKQRTLHTLTNLPFNPIKYFPIYFCSSIVITWWCEVKCVVVFTHGGVISENLALYTCIFGLTGRKKGRYQNSKTYKINTLLVYYIMSDLYEKINKNDSCL